MLEIDKIIASQRIVNLDHVRAIQKSFPKELTDDAIFDICMMPRDGHSKPDPLQVSQNMYVYSMSKPPQWQQKLMPG